MDNEFSCLRVWLYARAQIYWGSGIDGSWSLQDERSSVALARNSSDAVEDRIVIPKTHDGKTEFQDAYDGK